MMIHIEIDTRASSAFECNEGGEVERILCKLAHQLARGITSNDSYSLLDLNSNVVGKITTSKRTFNP